MTYQAIAKQKNVISSSSFIVLLIFVYLFIWSGYIIIYEPSSHYYISLVEI